MDKPFKRKAKRSRRGPNVQQWELWSQWGQSAEITARPHDTASVCHLSKEHNWSGASGPSNGTLWAHTFCNSCVLDESPHAALHQHYLAELSWFRNSERNTARGRPGCHFTALVYAKGKKTTEDFLLRLCVTKVSHWGKSVWSRLKCRGFLHSFYCSFIDTQCRITAKKKRLWFAVILWIAVLCLDIFYAVQLL